MKHTSGLRSFFWLMVRRDLQVRYAGSTLGALWNLIHPLMMIAIYMTIFSQIMRIKWGGGQGDVNGYGDLAYGVHLIAGMMPWLLFSDVLTRSVGVLIENSNFLQKVSFPPIVLFFSTFFNAFWIYGAGYLSFLVILLCMGHHVPIAALAGIGLMALMGLSAMGLGMILAALNVFFRDTGQVIQVLMQLLFWFNPIVYFKEQVFNPAKALDSLSLFERVGRVLMKFNPLERFITACQNLFGLVLDPPGMWDWTIIVVFPVVCLVAGMLLFRRVLPEVRDCL